MKDVIVSSRVRLARNLAGVPFPNRLTLDKATQKVALPVNKILSDNAHLTVINIMEISRLEQRLMLERHLISRDLMENALCGSVALNSDESIAIMINEEDHIREQCILPGLKLEECYERINTIDDMLLAGLDIAYDERLGFLTSSLTNIGTGMRASVMMFLPALTVSGKINDYIAELSKLSITVRGGYGEGSNAEGYLYQISNAVTLGVSEFDIIRNVNEAVCDLNETESALRVKLYRDTPTELTDRVLRAWGVLTNCFTITFEEFISNLAQVKLGLALGIIKLNDERILDDLDVKCRPANLLKTSGRDLNTEETDIFRADYLARVLGKKRIY